MNSTQKIRVMLVDDHNVVRSGLATFLKAYDDLELVAEAKNGLEVLRLCQRSIPDVIVMDLMMPEMDGIAATRAILDDYPEIKIIAMTTPLDVFRLFLMCPLDIPLHADQGVFNW